MTSANRSRQSARIPASLRRVCGAGYVADASIAQRDSLPESREARRIVIADEGQETLGPLDRLAM
jgi:hypothetical protein